MSFKRQCQTGSNRIEVAAIKTLYQVVLVKALSLSIFSPSYIKLVFLGYSCFPLECGT